MKTFLKWAGVFLVVFIVAFAGAMLVFGGVYRFADMPMMRSGFHMGRMGGPFWMFGGWLFMLARLLLPLAAIGLAVWFGYALGRRSNRTQMIAPAAADQAAPEPVVFSEVQPEAAQAPENRIDPADPKADNSSS